MSILVYYAVQTTIIWYTTIQHVYTNYTILYCSRKSRPRSDLEPCLPRDKSEKGRRVAAKQTKNKKKVTTQVADEMPGRERLKDQDSRGLLLTIMVMLMILLLLLLLSTTTTAATTTTTTTYDNDNHNNQDNRDNRCNLKLLRQVVPSKSPHANEHIWNIENILLKNNIQTIHNIYATQQHDIYK